MSRVIEALVMPGGWHKPEVDRTGQPLPSPIQADTFKLLVEAVRKFRADNLIPIGDPLADVEKYICEKFPGSCHSVPGATVQVTVKRGSTDKLTDEMIAWLDRALINHSQDKLVLKAKALERGEICRKCPMNVSWNRSCGVCSEAVGRLSSMVRAGQDVAFGKRLFACRVFKHENRSAVWLREQPPQEASGSAPAFCWAK